MPFGRMHWRVAFVGVVTVLLLLSISRFGTVPEQTEVAQTQSRPAVRHKPAPRAPRNAPPSPTLRVSLGRCPRGACDVVLDFNRELSENDRASLRPTLEPPQDGTWSWDSASRLRFKPSPGSLNWGAHVQVTIAKAPPLEKPWSATLRVPFLQRKFQ